MIQLYNHMFLTYICFVYLFLWLSLFLNYKNLFKVMNLNVLVLLSFYYDYLINLYTIHCYTDIKLMKVFYRTNTVQMV